MDDVDWSGPLRNYFGSVYGSTDVFSEEVTALNKLRQDVRGAANDNVGRDLLYKYYAQLELLALRIPISENECRINFTWHDSFTHQANTQHSLAFEKASLLFNLACINSHIGAESEDLKLSFNRFKDAAGIFTFIVGNFLHAPSTDLSQDTVKALCKLMIAQAQESFLERLLSEGSSSAMVPKLAKAASNLYSSAAEGLQGVFNEKTWGEKHWYQYCTVKSKYYSSVAHDQNSKTLENSGKYGEAIAHLQAALTQIQEASRLSIPSQFSTFTEVINNLRDAMKERLTKLDKENDLIYHATVPSTSSLDPIPALEAAPPTPMNDMYKDTQDLAKLIGRELFEKVIPLSVHQQTSLYSEEKASLLRSEGEKIEIAGEKLSSALEFLDLPNALNALSTDNSDILSLSKSQGIDSQVNEWAGQIAAQSNIKLPDFSTLDSIKRSIYEQMKQAEQLLQEEEKEYEIAKAEYKQNWSQASSATLNSGLLSDISRIKHDLSAASISDDKLKSMIGQSESDIQVLRLGANNPRLNQLFEGLKADTQSSGGLSLLDIDEGPHPQVQSLIEDARRIIDNLQSLKDERNAKFVDFKSQVHKDDISSILVLNNKNPDIQESLFKSELAKFQPFQVQFEESIQYQQKLLKELTMTWKNILEDKSVRNQKLQSEQLKSKRVALIERLSKAYMTWKDSQEGLNKANEFYENLKRFTGTTYRNAQDFVSNRREEAAGLKRTLASNSQDALRDQISRLSISSQSSQPLYSGSDNRGPIGYVSSPYSQPSYNTSHQSSTPSAPTASWGDVSTLERNHAAHNVSTSSVPSSVPSPQSAPTFSAHYGNYSTPSPSVPQAQPQYQQYSNSTSGQPGYAPPKNHSSYPNPPSVPSTPSAPAPHTISTPQYQYQAAPQSYSASNSYSNVPPAATYQQQPQQPQQPQYQQPPPPPQASYPPQSTYQQYQQPQAYPTQYGQPVTNTSSSGYQAPAQAYSAYGAQSGQPSVYGYANPSQKDYSKMPPPPPPSGNQNQGFYRQY